MITTIISRILFTCSTFLLLSASLFSMGPKPDPIKKGEEKRKQDLALEQRNRALSEEGVDSSSSLAQRLNECSISENIDDAQESSSSLQKPSQSANDQGMDFNNSAAQISGTPMSPERTKNVDASFSTPDTAHKKTGTMGNMGGGISIERTPPSQTPAKRIRIGDGSIFSPPSSLQNIEVMGKEEDQSLQHLKMDQALGNATHVLDYIVVIRKTALAISRSIDDLKTTEPLSNAVKDVRAAAHAVEIAKGKLESPEQRKEGFIMLSLSKAAVQKATTKLIQVATSLTTHPEKGTACLPNVKNLQELVAQHEALFKGDNHFASYVTSIKHPSSTTENLAKLQKSSEAYLVYAESLLGENITGLASTILQNCESYEPDAHCANDLGKLSQDLTSLISVTRVALDQVRQEELEGSSSFAAVSVKGAALENLKLAQSLMDENIKGIEEIIGTLDSTYRSSWPHDVNLVVTALQEAKQQHKSAVQ